jgi:tetratricopeptide (TPR) repeat protein
VKSDHVDIEEICPRREGDLEDVAYPTLLCAVARRRRSTALTISSQPKVKEIIFERGIPVQCRSNLAHETLSRFMQSIGALDEDTANECFAEACSRRLRFGDVLMDRGLIGAEELRRILQKNLARKLLDGFSWTQGRYRFSELPSEVDSSLKVNIPQLVILGATRFATQQQIDRAVGPLIGRLLTLHPEPVFDLGESSLSERHRAVVEALAARPQRIDELASTGGIDVDELGRLLYALTLIGTVVPVEAKPETSPVAPPTPTSPPPRPATTPSLLDDSHSEASEPPHAVSRERREELIELALNLRRKDPFDLLRVDPDDFGRLSHEKYLFFAERYAPWKYPRDLRDDARRVFLAGARAYGDIADPDRRHALIDRRSRSAGVSDPAASCRFRIETDLLDPEVQYRKGRALMAEDNYRDALEQLAYASDLDPQNGAYRAELAYCRYLYNPQAGAPAALGELDKALRIDPSSGLVHYYRGEMLRVLGRLDEAEASLKRSIRPMAPDRRPIEALRAIRKQGR